NRVLVYRCSDRRRKWLTPVAHPPSAIKHWPEPSRSCDWRLVPAMPAEPRTLDRSEQRRRFRQPGPPLTPGRPELFAILPHDRGSSLESNADGAMLVDKRTFGSNPPDDILGGQNRRHPTTSRRSRIRS